jgi:putative ABC transport system permease protein
MNLHFYSLLFRNIKKNKVSFFINVIGLSAGIVCTVLIYLWIDDELKIGRFHRDGERIFQVLENQSEENVIITEKNTSGLMAETLAGEVPGVEYAATEKALEGDVLLSAGDKNFKATGFYVSKDYFNIFSFPIVVRKNPQLLNGQDDILLSEVQAVKMFGSAENALGKEIEFDHSVKYYVSGVFTSPSPQALKHFDFALSFEAFAKKNDWAIEWRNTPVKAYIKLSANAQDGEINKMIKDLIRRKTNDEVTHRQPFLTLYADQYLYGSYQNGVQNGGRIEYVRLFSIIAVFILVIACINFMNLSTAQASRRVKEVGIKKALGVERRALLIQFLGESVAITLFSLLVGLLLVSILVPSFNAITDKDLSLSFSIQIVVLLITIVVGTGLLAGSYPAFYLSGFNPATVLKGKLNRSVGEMLARKGLVIFQFVVSVVMIVLVVVVYQQIKFIQTKDLGVNRDHIIWFEREGVTENSDYLQSFVAELKKVQGVQDASAIGHGLAGKSWGVYGFEWEGKDRNDNTLFEHVAVYYDMLEMLGVKLLSGRAFSEDFSPEKSKVIFNEAAIAHMGLKDPVGKHIRFWGADKEIIGVVKDFHYESLHETIRPLMFSYWPEKADRIMVKMQPGQSLTAIDNLKGFYAQYNPGYILDYRFLNSEYQALYVAEQRVATLSRFFALLAVVISCLGLFGLAAFSAERRQKEISIRKIMGSSQMAIVMLLSTSFTKNVLISIAIALPVSYLLAKHWLADFAYKISLEWWYFAMAGVAALVITWATIAFQLIKASNVNPLQSIRES